jgi:para-nitrobenzyl esterase
MVDVTHETAATFDSDLERSVGQLPPVLVAAYPHATDDEARQARLGLERRSPLRL